MNKYAAVIEQLQFAKAEIEKLLTEPEDENHRIRLTHRLQVDIDHINLLHNVGLKVSPPAPAGPATTMGGKPIIYKKRVTEEDVKPEETDVAVLKKFVKEAYDSFLTTENSEILKMNDTVVRGVAKKAGMNKVNKDNPEKITDQFINEIKEAIKSKK
jgi:hypothetical protein